MAISEKQKQKKLLKKKQKRTAVSKAVTSFVNRISATSCAGYPLHECWVTDDLFEIGIGEALIVRQLPDGELAVSVFMVDVFCLGVKNAFFTVLPKSDYDNLKSTILERGCEVENLHPSCAKKLVVGAVAYAKALGFNPHADYKQAAALFGAIDDSVCPVNYQYGKDNKPFYFRGPHESLAQAQKIIKTLQKKFGEGGFDYLVELEDDF